MSDRRPMPGAMPAELAERMSDVDDHADLDELAALREAKEKAREDVQTSEWWFDRLEGEASAWSVSEAISRCMREIDAACKGDTIAMRAITTALSNLQASAIQDAEDYP